MTRVKRIYPGVNDATNFAPLRNLDAKLPVSYGLPSLKSKIAYAADGQVCLSADEAIVIADYTTGKKCGK